MGTLTDQLTPPQPQIHVECFDVVTGLLLVEADVGFIPLVGDHVAIDIPGQRPTTAICGSVEQREWLHHDGATMDPTAVTGHVVVEPSWTVLVLTLHHVTGLREQSTRVCVSCYREIPDGAFCPDCTMRHDGTDGSPVPTKTKTEST